MDVRARFLPKELDRGRAEQRRGTEIVTCVWKRWLLTRITESICMTRSLRFSATLCARCVLLNAVSSRVRFKSAVKGTFADKECWAILRDGVEKFSHREQF